jgi:hypothetical protein
MIWVWTATVEWFIDRGKQKNSEKPCASATLSTTNPTWIDPGANPGLRGERSAANDLSHGTATDRCIIYLWTQMCLRFTSSHRWKHHMRGATFLLPALQCTSRGSYLCVIGPDHGGSTHHWYVGHHLLDYTAVRPRRLQTSFSPPREPEISHNIDEVWYRC